MDETRKIYKVMAGEIRDKVEDLCVVMYRAGYEDATAKEYEAGYEAGFRHGLEEALRRVAEA